MKMAGLAASTPNVNSEINSYNAYTKNILSYQWYNPYANLFE